MQIQATNQRSRSDRSREMAAGGSGRGDGALQGNGCEVLGLEYRKNSEDGHTELCNESYNTVTCVVRILLELLRP